MLRLCCNRTLPIMYRCAVYNEAPRDAAVVSMGMLQHSRIATCSIDGEPYQAWNCLVLCCIGSLKHTSVDVVVLFPFHIPIYVPWWLSNGVRNVLFACRITPRRQTDSQRGLQDEEKNAPGYFELMRFPMNFITAPVIADLFLLAILAIGRDEVRQGTVGADNINPIDIMVFFLSLAYIAISIDASGLIRWLAFKVLQRAGKNGHRLYFYLYIFFFALATFAGNDPIILSGTAFLAYMTRVSSNIEHPRAWIYAQFTMANVGSAILVSSNPTNLVLAGAFEIKFIVYTANMIVPVIVTAIILFPFLLYVIFPNEKLIPTSITLHELPEALKHKKPINPNIPHAREGEETADDGDEGQLLSLEEIMNPFLDKGGAAFGAVIMTATLVTILALNASSQNGQEHPVFWVTLPAAFVMFCWDLGFGWTHRHDTRNIARKGRERLERARAERALEIRSQGGVSPAAHDRPQPKATLPDRDDVSDSEIEKVAVQETNTELSGVTSASSSSPPAMPAAGAGNSPASDWKQPSERITSNMTVTSPGATVQSENQLTAETNSVHHTQSANPVTLYSLVRDSYIWLQETFPTVMAVFAHLPFPLIPFALAMFVLVQALVTKGWVPVFAHGWDHWVAKTGVVGAIGGMGFLSVILCNFAGTNIGTTILLCRVVQAWVLIHDRAGTVITQRTFWATVYSMAIGVNFGAFSTAFSASLAGMLWRDILERKHIKVRGLDFARMNLPIIAVAMTVGLAVLVGEVYITRNTSAYVG
nr:hypothetical protein CFP56_11786 [Quercus suber]